MKGLIIAAGQGIRMRDKGDIKPLIDLVGMPLIERVIRNARSGGIDEFYVVSGFRGTRVRAFLDELADRENISITHIINEDWQKANGISVLKARDVIDGPFLLTMCDLLFDPEIIRSAMALEPGTDSVTLCVDRNIDNPLYDKDMVMRVKCSEDHMDNIGRVIKDYNAYDTGIFRCSPAIFDAIEVSEAEGDGSLSGAMSVLASQGKARTMDVNGRFWLDIDDPTAYGIAIALVQQGRL